MTNTMNKDEGANVVQTLYKGLVTSMFKDAKTVEKNKLGSCRRVV